MKDTLSINEVAELAKVTTQSIYKRLKKKDNPIQAYVVMEGNQTMLKKEVLSEIYNKQIEGVGLCNYQPSLKVDQPIKEEHAEQQKTKEETIENKKEASETASFKVIEILREQIKMQNEEIQQKNKVIADLNERLADSQRMLDQQQRLSLADKQQILMLEEKARSKRGIISKFINLFKSEEATNNEQ